MANIISLLQVVIIAFAGSILVIDSLNLFAMDPSGDQELGRGAPIRIQRYTGSLADFTRGFVFALKVAIVPAYVMVVFLIGLEAIVKVPLSLDFVSLIFVIVVFFTILGVSCLVIMAEFLRRRQAIKSR